MTNPLPTWLRAFRMVAVASVFFQIIYVFLLSPTKYGIPWIDVFGLYLVLNFLIVAPWLPMPRAWVWWLCYAFLIFFTYSLSKSVVSIWAYYMAGLDGSFLALPAKYKFMFIYATSSTFFFIAQIIVLPFYRNCFIQLKLTDNPAPS